MVAAFAQSALFFAAWLGSVGSFKLPRVWCHVQHHRGPLSLNGVREAMMIQATVLRVALADWPLTGVLNAFGLFSFCCSRCHCFLKHGPISVL